MIDKGCIYIEERNEDNNNENQGFIFFMTPSRKIILLEAKIEIKNVKLKGRREILRQKHSVKAEKDENLP
jgi:hypothetical protein